jgi:regulator of sigma E protease
MVQRGSRLIRVRLIPRLHPPPGQGAIGIELADDTTVRYGATAALGRAAREETDILAALPAFLAGIPAHGTAGLSGPIGIAHYTTDAVQAAPQTGPSPVLLLAALLTISLGALNLRPFPALDGGRVVFVLLSWVRRRNLDPEVEGLVHMVGMAILLMLIVVISYQDLAQWITGGSS